MDKFKSFLGRLIVCALAYAVLEGRFSGGGRRRGIFESAAKAAAIAFTAAVLSI